MTVPALDIAGLSAVRGAGAEAFRLELPALTLAPGEVLAVAGESGSGKSTLLGLLGLLAKPDRVARFRLAVPGAGPEDVTARLSAGDLDALAGLRRRALGFVLQQGGLLPFLSVADNIALAAPEDRDAPFAVGALAERLGIGATLDRRPGALSVGQRQRAAIARAVMADPAVILADEPTAALDPPAARATLELFLSLAGERGTAVIVATHAWSLIEEFALPVLSPTTVAGPGGAVARFAPAGSPALRRAEGAA